MCLCRYQYLSACVEFVKGSAPSLSMHTPSPPGGGGGGKKTGQTNQAHEMCTGSDINLLFRMLHSTPVSLREKLNPVLPCVLCTVHVCASFFMLPENRTTAPPKWVNGLKDYDICHEYLKRSGTECSLKRALKGETCNDPQLIYYPSCCPLPAAERQLPLVAGMASNSHQTSPHQREGLKDNKTTCCLLHRTLLLCCGFWGRPAGTLGIGF